MSDKKHANAARNAFRSSHSKVPPTEHEEKQRALLKNLERLKAERLAREAAKSKEAEKSELCRSELIQIAARSKIGDGDKSKHCKRIGGLTMWWGTMEPWGYGGYGQAHMVIWIILGIALVAGIMWRIRSGS